MNAATLIQKILNLVPFKIRSKVKNMPILKQIQAFILRKWFHEKEFTAKISGGPAKGLIFPVKLPQDKQMWIGTWELDFAEALKNCIKPGWICYDIGGYKGYYSGVMALKGATSVFVFEPMPTNIEKIEKLIELNPSLPIYLKTYAVSDNNNQAVFKLMPEETMGKLENSSFQKDDKALNSLTVECITLDTLVSNGTPEPDFVKIDVEGAEEFVLKGALSLLERKRPFLMIEVHSPIIGKRCMEILKNYYSTVQVLETGLSPENGTPEICHYLVYN